MIHIISAQIHEANRAQTALEAQRSALLHERAPADLDAFFDAVLDEWPDYTIPEKKQIARAVIARVVVGDDTIEVVFRADCGAGAPLSPGQ